MKGYPDILVLQGSQNANFQLIGFQNILQQDVHFFKVMVLSTFSCEPCSHQRKLVNLISINFSKKKKTFVL